MKKKPAIILTYEPFRDVLQRLNLDNKNIFFQQIFTTISVYQTGE